jgi:uncharacterized membrane protein YgdD (TMEM256/DUF423 family)
MPLSGAGKENMNPQQEGLPHLWLVAGCVNMLLAVALGAFGGHVLKARLAPELMAIYQTGNQYHVYHALGLFAVAFASRMVPASRVICWSGGLIAAGLILFCGSLYILSLSGQLWIGMITPFGGSAFLAGWLLLAIGAWKARGSGSRHS